MLQYSEFFTIIKCKINVFTSLVFVNNFNIDVLQDVFNYNLA